MVVHHLNCATLCPGTALLVNGRGSPFGRSRLVCHCLLIEGARDGLILVDTGLGLRDVADGRGRLGPMAFMMASCPHIRLEETAIHQLAKLRHRPEDVRHIVVTHLDPDHTGGLDDFPDATVHVFQDEYRAAENPMTWRERQRYKFERWGGVKWQLHRLRGGEWMGLESVSLFDPRRDGVDVRLVPLVGHTRGQVGVAVGTGERWLLHCADAYFCTSEMTAARPHCTPGLSILQRFNQVSGAARRGSLARLRELRQRDSELTMFCAHDPDEFDSLARPQARAQ